MANEKEQKLPLEQVPAPVKAAIQNESQGGKLEKVTKETEGGRTFYEAEIEKDGKEFYVHVSEDGKVLKRESEESEREERRSERQEM
jgi:uncharacterized membrane protein YkoI